MDAQNLTQDSVQDASGIEIAIIGMAGRFPGAANLDTYWTNIRDGVEAVVQYSVEQLRQQGVPDALLDDPDYVRASMPLADIDKFDADFFGYTPRDAENLDPQQRIFLECAWQALEHAGYDAQQLAELVGVYAGDGPNLYLLQHLLPTFGLEAGSNIADLLGLMSGNSAGSLATRVAYKLNLRGPALSVQTACSTSLTAMHLACQGLLSHDCDMALAGGVWLNLLQEGGYRYQAGAILSPDGHCRAFDAKAEGTLVGSGAGIVVLKRLADALRDGDSIHAIIKGSAANNDGHDKIGFTAPSVSGQANVIQAAQIIADVPADTIGYIEAHGTGTRLGDPIEVAALTQAFRHSTQRRGFCALGSVKTNIGHLDAAAGVAGLIKTVLALQHKTLPPSLHFQQPNSEINFASSPFYVCTQATPWPAGETPRRAGVSSFGIGGTNVHLILEEAPAVAVTPEGTWQVLPLAARDETALRQYCDQLAAHIRRHPEQPLSDIAHTLQVGRKAFSRRCAAVANSAAMAAELLVSSPFQQGSVTSQSTHNVAFLFPGGGTQHCFMATALYARSAVFRDTIDRCCALLLSSRGLDLRPYLFPSSPQDKAQADENLFRMAIAQPALFVVEYALAQWWMQCGVRPTLMLGHSLGEYVAACISGVFSLQDALHIVALRGQLMETLAAGAMTAVPLTKEEVAPFLALGCDLAAANADKLSVLAGPLAIIENVEARLRDRDITPRRLRVAIASHSAMVEPMLAQLEQAIAAAPRQAPSIPFISNVTGKRITAEQAMSPAYWGQHLRSTVRFRDGLSEILSTPGVVVLEVGPGETLTGLARQHSNAASAAGIWPSQAHPQQYERNDQQLAQAVAGVWTSGIDVDWKAVRENRQPRRVPLPTYPFQRRRYWVEAAKSTAQPATTTVAAEDGIFYYTPSWQRSHLSEANAIAKQDVKQTGITLVLGDHNSLTASLLNILREQDATVVLATRGAAFAQLNPLHYAVRGDSNADLERLLRAVETDQPVARIFHLWSLDGEQPATTPTQIFEAGFFSLLALTQALQDTVADAARTALALTIVTDRMEDVTGTEPLAPEKATVLGLAKVLGQEYPHIRCRLVDVVLPAPESYTERELAQHLVTESLTQQGDFLTAYRGPHRWNKTYIGLPATASAKPRLRNQGVYLITGGLGGVGLAIARHLAHHWQARLVLLGRTALPERSAWKGLSTDPSLPPIQQRKFQQLLELVDSGAEFMTVAADVNDPQQMQQALAQVKNRFGAVQGVIHAVVHPERGMIAQRTREKVEVAFAPKLIGTQVLLDVLKDAPLDFYLLCSSIASFIGGLGRSDYAGANAYLDALARQLRRSSRLPVFSVNWDAWRDVGIALDMNLPAGVGLDERSGMRALERILNGPTLPQIVVSTAPLEQRLQASTEDFLDVLDGIPTSTSSESRHSRPVLQIAYVAPESVLETDLVELWSELLGITPIGVHDNIFELGGDSLLAVRLLAQVRKIYGIELHPATFFRTPTIAALANAIEIRLIEEIEAYDFDADDVETDDFDTSSPELESSECAQ